MRTILKCSLILATLVLCASPTFAGKGTPPTAVIVPFDPPVDANGNPIVDPSVYNGFCPAGPNLLVRPDGQPVTLSQWLKATGTGSLQCVGNGTYVSVRYSGLIPNGVYSVWVVVFGPGPANENNLLGAGALGRPDGTQNHFVASNTGEGRLNVLMPPGILSFIPYNIGPCLLNDPPIGEVQLHLAYHNDGQTHGGTPGPDCDFAIPLAITFVTGH